MKKAAWAVFVFITVISLMNPLAGEARGGIGAALGAGGGHWRLSGVRQRWRPIMHPIMDVIMLLIIHLTIHPTIRLITTDLIMRRRL